MRVRGERKALASAEGREGEGGEAMSDNSEGEQDDMSRLASPSSTRRAPPGSGFESLRVQQHDWGERQGEPL